MQRRRAPAADVAEPRRRPRVSTRRIERSHARARELRAVGPAGAEVDPRRVGAAPAGAGARRLGPERHARVAARAAGQVALGASCWYASTTTPRDTPRSAASAARRRQRRAARQPPGPDRVADPRLDLAVQRHAGSRSSSTSRSPAAQLVLSKSTESDLIPGTNSWKPGSPCARSSTRPTSPSTASSRRRICGRPAAPSDERAETIQTDLLLACDALLMGRRTYEGFAPVWPTRSGDPYTDRINTMPKYVVSRRRSATRSGATRRSSPAIRRGDPRAQGGARQGHRAVRLRPAFARRCWSTACSTSCASGSIR